MVPKTLLLGTKRKLLPAFYYALDHGHDVSILNVPPYHKNDDDMLRRLAKDTFDSFDMLINFKETSYYLNLELELNPKNFLNESNIKFFSTKKEQDRIFKLLDIPTIPNQSEKILMKSDLSGGTNFLICGREQIKKDNRFFQDYVNIDYIISCHFYARDGVWYWLNNHIMEYNNNCPKKSNTTVDLLDKDVETIEDSIRALRDLVYIDNKLFGWQFLKDDKGNLYSIDFNLRPFGGFDMGSYDTDVSDQNWISYLYGNDVPSHIKYHSQVSCVYDQDTPFGYEDWVRVKRPISVDFEVKKYG